jgi:hypothetical protein
MDAALTCQLKRILFAIYIAKGTHSKLSHKPLISFKIKWKNFFFSPSTEFFCLLPFLESFQTADLRQSYYSFFWF